jgi:hypothetical protein
MMDWIRRVLAWDEQMDPAAAPLPVQTPKERPWRRLGLADRELLEALAEGTWVPEGALRKQLRWGRGLFFFSTVRLVQMGWIQARATNGRVWESDYRLNPEVWV